MKLAGVLLIAMVSVVLSSRVCASTPYRVVSHDGLNSPQDPVQLVNVNGTLLFSAGTDPFARTLWKSNGTEESTRMVHPVNPQAALDSFQVYVAIGHNLFYSADSTDGGELWKSNGTSAGTMRVKDILAGPNSTTSTLLNNVNGLLLFMGNGTGGQWGLWRSDGTEAGTTFVHPASVSNIPAPTTASDFAIVVGSNFYFRNQDVNSGSELWKSDGTTMGTMLVKDTWRGRSGGSPQSLTDVNGTLFFTALDDSVRRKLWISDGTEQGTRVVKDTGYFSFSPNSEPLQLVNVDGTLFFTSGDGNRGVELWKSDGTEAGTMVVKDLKNLTPGGTDSEVSSRPDHLANVNGTLYFTADDGVHGRELWKSDGTADGTQLVIDLSPGNLSTRFYYENQTKSEFLAVNDLLFFTAAVRNATGGFDNNLFVTDGTAGGTRPLLTFANSGLGAAPISELTFTGSHLFFRAVPQLGRPAELYALILVPEPACVTLIGLASVAIIWLSRPRRLTPIRPSPSS
jgi:ELWxxDGT repeat protein